MRIGFVGLWLVLIVAGAWKISSRHPAPRPDEPAFGCIPARQKKERPHWIATRAMPLNWLVRKADLLAPQGAPPPQQAFLAKYAACKIAAGEPLIESDLTAVPQVPVTAGKMLVPFPVSTQDADALNAGSRVSLYDGLGEVVSGVEVAAVDCRSSCVALLQTTNSERQILEAKQASVLRLVLR